MEIAIFVVIIVVALACLLLLIFWPRIKKSGKKTEQPAGEKKDPAVEKIEKTYTKKCIHCGEPIPLDDKICPSCNGLQEQ